MGQSERRRSDQIRAVKDEIKVDDAWGVAGGAAAAKAGLDGVQRFEQRPRLEIGVTGDHGVQIFRRRRVHRIGLDEGADADDVDDVPQLIDGAAEKERALREAAKQSPGKTAEKGAPPPGLSLAPSKPLEPPKGADVPKAAEKTVEKPAEKASEKAPESSWAWLEFRPRSAAITINTSECVLPLTSVVGNSIFWTG